ncbi:MAG: hypothetical protein HWN68_06480 [Desulfobacterales bacterium]|nr:hypothetical protein [Desulfobacterales bacterium]
MAYEKFISARGGQGKTFPAPYVTVNKGGMSFNRHAKEMIGDGFKFVVFFFDKQASKIGFWFWKDVCPGSYALIWHKSRKHFTVNGKSFYKAYGILEKIEKCDTRHFPLEPDKESKQNNDFYCIRLEPPKGR